MYYLIDTNIISEVRKAARCDRNVAAWYATIDDDEVYLSVLVAGEIRKGIELARRRDPMKARALERWLRELDALFGDRILPINRAVTDEWGRMSAQRPIPVVDGLLAATAKVHGMTLVTRNDGHVAGLGAGTVEPVYAARGVTRLVGRVNPCQALRDPRFPPLSISPGGQLSAWATRWPAPGGGCGARPMRGPSWRFMSVRTSAIGAVRISPGGNCRVVVSGAVKCRKRRRGESLLKSSGSRSRRSSRRVSPLGGGTDDRTGCISLSWDWPSYPSCSSTTERSSPRASHRQCPREFDGMRADRAGHRLPRQAA